MKTSLNSLLNKAVPSRRRGEDPVWRSDREFSALFKEIEGRTLVSPDRCFMLFQFARHAAGRGGEMAEVGVYRGGTARLLARTCPGRTFHLFDTFSGLPPVDPGIDLHREAEFSDSSLDAVRDYLSGLENLRFHPGTFPDSARKLAGNRFCFVHVDVDIYRSTADCLDFFYPRLAPGGVMAFDDYGWEGCPGVKKALDEFLASRPEFPILTARHQCVLIKQ